MAGKGKKETQFKPGQSGNPQGRPKVPEDLKRARAFTKIEVSKILARHLDKSRRELNLLIQDPDTPALEAFVASLMVQGIRTGDERRLNFLFDRIIGKVKDEVEVAQVSPFIVKYKDEKVVMGIQSQEDEEQD
jgi:hypothetical protein